MFFYVSIILPAHAPHWPSGTASLTRPTVVVILVRALPAENVQTVKELHQKI